MSQQQLKGETHGETRKNMNKFFGRGYRRINMRLDLSWLFDPENKKKYKPYLQVREFTGKNGEPKKIVYLPLQMIIFGEGAEGAKILKTNEEDGWAVRTAGFINVATPKDAERIYLGTTNPVEFVSLTKTQTVPEQEDTNEEMLDFDEIESDVSEVQDGAGESSEENNELDPSEYEF